MNKIVYIIPGFTETTNLEGYKEIIRKFKSKNFKVVPIKITWKFRTMDNYIEEFFNQHIHQKTDEIYFFGFSFGAMIAFISTTILKPKKLFLCSLSPYFNEDLKFLKKSWKKGIGKKELEKIDLIILKNFHLII